ncbi:MAG: hypothetical protein JNL67_11960 [Planctomycetaceae bacterium]|nr:hypothetical protein [Planctomycetaceae bacterium]
MKRHWFFCGFSAVFALAQVSESSAQVNYQTASSAVPIVAPVAGPKTTSDGGCDSGCSTGVSACCDGVGAGSGGGLLGGGLIGGGLLGGGGFLSGGLLGFIKPSDHCYDDFISPMTNPTHFEDPRTLTEARFIYLRHKVPLTAAGGVVNLFALQLRAAVTERLSIIATKDGFIASSNPLIDDGWADLAAGLKYNLLSDPAGQGLLSIGSTFELHNGSARSLQGNGDGVFNFFLSGAQKLTDRSHYMGSFGYRAPLDTNLETSMLYWSHHVDRKITSRLYLLAEANWYHWLDSGIGLNGLEGGDLFNIGGNNVTGNDIVTTAIGAKFKPSGHQEIGVAWEFPVTERRDVLDNRLTFDWIIRY